MIIAVDFDGTICEHKYPEIGAAKLFVINWLLEHKKNGTKLILYTCRDGIYLEQAIEWCKQFNLFFDAINDDVQEIKDTFTFKSNKIYADLYLDDRNCTLLEIRRLMERLT